MSDVCVKCENSAAAARPSGGRPALPFAPFNTQHPLACFLPLVISYTHHPFPYHPFKSLVLPETTTTMPPNNGVQEYMQRVANAKRVALIPIGSQSVSKPSLESLPQAVLDRLVHYLRWDSLRRLSSVNKHFSQLLPARYPTKFFQKGLSRLPPHLRGLKEEEAPEQQRLQSIHPIFMHIFFQHTFKADAVRVRGPSGQLLRALEVRKEFATIPTVTELHIKIIPFGERKFGENGQMWDLVCPIKSELGVTVWDVVEKVLEFFGQEALLDGETPPLRLTARDWFGKVKCDKMGIHPGLIMLNNDFMQEDIQYISRFPLAIEVDANPRAMKRPWPKFLIIDPYERGQIIADYALSKWVQDLLKEDRSRKAAARKEKDQADKLEQDKKKQAQKQAQKQSLDELYWY
ncbi:hypothetical protein FN846DRAFT_502268 [Sphaerosporella brunnea]|uniref:F-box domain-containing protein n=1 Tax=Sphaerosporella brunnea TaxID=1250544 RepID=A0A5J5EFA5_9PEZI|nr:hypothetical protein FN846DRAFT_502268 [Sphaerosporella brunnea]